MQFSIFKSAMPTVPAPIAWMIIFYFFSIFETSAIQMWALLLLASTSPSVYIFTFYFWVTVVFFFFKNFLSHVFWLIHPQLDPCYHLSYPLWSFNFHIHCTYFCTFFMFPHVGLLIAYLFQCICLANLKFLAHLFWHCCRFEKCIFSMFRLLLSLLSACCCCC